jgi:hypothetical protein
MRLILNGFPVAAPLKPKPPRANEARSKSVCRHDYGRVTEATPTDRMQHKYIRRRRRWRCRGTERSPRRKKSDWSSFHSAAFLDKDLTRSFQRFAVRHAVVRASQTQSARPGFSNVVLRVFDEAGNLMETHGHCRQFHERATPSDARIALVCRVAWVCQQAPSEPR